jgi:radical SAM-linked protein
MRLRITFSKQGPLRYAGHLDLQKLWERAARRAGLPLAYSQGFHPQPRISLASALPLGFSSRAEVVDLKLREAVPVESVAARLGPALPAGLNVLQVETVDDDSPPLQAELLAAEFEATLADDPEPADLDRRVQALLAAESLPRERRGKAYDLRPLVEDLRVMVATDAQEDSAQRAAVRLWMRLAAREGATGRPEEVLAAMGIATHSVRVERSRLAFRPRRDPAVGSPAGQGHDDPLD